MITFKHKGNFNGIEGLLKNGMSSNYMSILEKYGREGVLALASATPIDTGNTANSWGYEIRKDSRGATIFWTNSNVVDGTPIAIIIQYGHGTNNGGYVQGYDYINPALQSIFDKIAEEAWREVTKR